MLKKILIAIMLMMTFLCNAILRQAEAADEWVYSNLQGESLYVVYESVVYGVKTSFYARARIKTVSVDNQLLKSDTWEFGADEGDWWYGIINTKDRGRRVYDHEDAVAVLNWLQAHEKEARRTGNMFEKVLSPQ